MGSKSWQEGSSCNGKSIHLPEDQQHLQPVPAVLTLFPTSGKLIGKLRKATFPQNSGRKDTLILFIFFLIFFLNKETHFRKKHRVYISYVAIMKNIRKESFNILPWRRRDLSGRRYWITEFFLHFLTRTIISTMKIFINLVMKIQP